MIRVDPKKSYPVILWFPWFQSEVAGDIIFAFPLRLMSPVDTALNEYCTLGVGWGREKRDTWAK